MSRISASAAAPAATAPAAAAAFPSATRGALLKSWPRPGLLAQLPCQLGGVSSAIFVLLECTAHCLVRVAQQPTQWIARVDLVHLSQPT